MTMTRDATFDRLAAPYDRGMAPLERIWLRKLRQRMAPHANGDVLEVGVGTGANMPYYPPSTCLMAVDESPDMLGFAASRAAAHQHCARLGQANIEHLAFANHSFDTVVASLVLCSVVDQNRALTELYRVLRKPRGQLLLIEHMRPHPRAFGWLVDLANVPWSALQDRCHLNRRTQDNLAQNGFTIESVETEVAGLLRLIVARVA